MKKSKLCLLLSILTLSLNLAAAPGDRDVSFGTLGVASFNYGSAIQVVSMEQQGDGKTLVLAYTVDANPRLILRRHNTNGTLDTSFGNQGEALEPAGLNRRVYGKAVALKINPGDGTIYVVGESGNPRVAMVWRFTRFGFVDYAFGTNGKQCICGLNVTESFGIDIDVYSGRAVVMYQETKLVNGPSGYVPITYTYLTRLLSSGQIDTAFGVSGYRNLDYKGGTGITLEPGSGSIYVYGYLMSNVASSLSGLKVLRYLSSGAPDTTFPELWYPSSFPDFPDSFLNCDGLLAHLRDLVIQPDGRFVNSFHFRNIGGAVIWDAGFVRHERTGVTDFTWGPLPYGVQCDEEVVDLGHAFFGPHRNPQAVIHSDGRLVTLAWNSNYPNLKRRLADGTIDTTFQPNYASGLGTAVSVLVQRVDQKVVVLSSFQYVNQYTDTRVLGYKLIRYLP